MATLPLVSRLVGLVDSRGPRGIAARGNNVYKGVSMAAKSGPNMNAVARRMAGERQSTRSNLGQVARREVAARQAMPNSNNFSRAVGKPVDLSTSGPGNPAAVARRLNRR